MSSWLKTVLVMFAVVPMAMYVAGSLASPGAGEPADRGPVIIDGPRSPTSDSPGRTPGKPGKETRDGQREGGSAPVATPSPERTSAPTPATTTPTPIPKPSDGEDGEARDDESARVVTPRPTPVDDDAPEDPDEDDDTITDEDDDDAEDGGGDHPEDAEDAEDTEDRANSGPGSDD